MYALVRFITLFGFVSTALAALADGRVRGVVRTESGAAPGVTVVFKSGGSETARTTTDGNGNFRISLTAGAYLVEFSAPGLEPNSENVEINEGAVLNMDVMMTSKMNIQEAMTVQSASRRPERIVEAPAAVTVITNKELSAQKASAQLPRVLENTPGVELAQNGAYDFNVNARGFNSSLNRRVLVLVDGRNPAVGFLGNQEWSTLPYPLDEFDSVEFVRGPGSALYGANAFSGVLNIRTKRPSNSQGASVSVSGGELDTAGVALRYAGELGSQWSYRINGGYRESTTWSESRTAADRGPDGEFEYAGLAEELVPFDDRDLNAVFGALRIDYEFGDNVLTLEGGTSESENGLTVTGIGRVRIDESKRPFYRVNLNGPRYNISYANTMRETPVGQTSMSSGGRLWEDSSIQHLEAQVNYTYRDRLFMVGGAAYTDQDIDTANADGFQTLMREAHKEDQQSLYGQATFKVNDHWDLVLAGRWDDSSLHDAQESPKAAIVWKVNENHTLRLTWNEAFQTANYSEFFLRAPSTTLVPFGQIQDAVVLGGFGLDLRNTLGADGEPILDWKDFQAVAAGNDALVPEHVESLEFGYKGIIGSKLFLTFDYYQSTITNFITDLLPGVNSRFQPYQFDDDVPAAVQAALTGVLQGALGPSYGGVTSLDQDSDPFFGTRAGAGNPVLVVSYTNAGEVDTEGFDLAFNYYLNDHITIDGNYSWFDFDVVDQLVGDQLLPNSAENKFNLGFSYSNKGFSGSLKYHWVEEFQWAAGAFAGVIPEFDTLNLTAQYRFNDNWEVSLAGNNIADNEHYELFGGSVNGRRIMVSLSASF